MKSRWQTKPLGEVCPISNRKVVQFARERPYFATGAVGPEGELSDPEYVSFASRPSRADCMPQIWDVGFARMKGTKKIVLIDETLKGALFSTGFCFLAPQADIDHRFLFYFATSDDFQNAKDEAAGDGIMGGVKNAAVAQIQIPLPSLAEQQRIVGILNETFEGIATAKINAEKNVQNAREVYASVLEYLLQDSVDNCETAEFGELIQTLTDYHANGSYEVLKRNVELKDTEDFAWMVRSTDFENDFQNMMRYVTEAAYNFLTKSRIFGGEIIMSKIGNAGKVYLMPEITRPCSLAMNLFLIRLNENKASNRYVYRYLKSKRGEAQILAKLKGTATQTITKESVRSLRIPLLPRNVQDRIVSKLENVEVETQRLESIYQHKLAALEALKKSLLHQAFNGKL